MAARKDNKDRALRKGEFQRASDGKYVYGYTDPNGVRRYIYSKDLKKLREREEKLVKDQLDGMTGFIFTNRFGTIHNPQAVNRAIKRSYEAYNAEEIVKAKNEHRDPVIIPHFSCHHMRHIFCTRILLQQVLKQMLV